MSEELNKLEQLFHAALELASEEERSRYLTHACGADAALRKRVEKLLRAHATAGHFLSPETPGVRGGLPFSGVDLPASEKPGDQIGRYTLVERLGEGSCCMVYRAQQAEPVRRQVALKLIKMGMDTRQVVARFEVERQALALMDHPHIAKVFDAGVTTTGRPYFVMELLRGIPITEFCDKHRLTVKQRLELFGQVCVAVQHAHQKGIIHRDLKPSNILVTTDDSLLGCPKIIDFGIAKAMQAHLTDRAVVTWFGQFVGTPAYMCPEQASMSSEDIDARADIYSLGALLYELLTGVTPFGKETLADAGFDEIRRMIQEKDPPKPSVRLRAGEKLSEVACRRQTEPGALFRSVRGDLDWIVMKALEKDRQRRYATANDLAQDVQRHLEHEPVLAGPPGPLYRTQKFVRRHRVGVAVGAAATLALVAGLSLALVGLQRALTAEMAASRDRDRALQAEQLMRRERDRAVQAEADTRGILSLFKEELGALEDPMALYDAAARLARERLELNPAAVNFLVPLGRNLGRRGAWTNTLEVYLWLTKATSWSCDFWTHAHAAALAAGLPDTSRRLREHIVERFGDTKDGITAMQVARGVLMDPEFKEHLQTGLDCADRAYRGYPNEASCQIVKGIAEYRRGNWSAAVELLQKPERNQDLRLAAIACSFGAMARHQIGQTNEALESLSRVSWRLRQLLHSGLLASNEWHFVVFGLQARAEAERLLLGKEVSPVLTAELLAEARQQWKFVREHVARGESLAREKRWAESRDAYAAALYSQAFDWTVAESESIWICLSLQMGMAFTRAGDDANYAHLCRLLVAQGVTKPHHPSGERVASDRAQRYAMAFCLNPAGLPPELREKVLEHSRFAVANPSDNPGWMALSGGMAEYNFGEPERALELSQRASKEEDSLLAAMGSLYTAMTLHKLNRSQEATEALQNAEAQFTQACNRELPGTWWDLEHAEQTLHQARQLLRANAR